MVAPTNVRFPDAVEKLLADYARQAGAKKSTVVVGRYGSGCGCRPIRASCSSRRSAGNGARPWRSGFRCGPSPKRGSSRKGERTAAAVADALGLTAADVEVTLAYWADYRDEIDELISRHHASQDEALHVWERRRALDAV